MNKQAKRTVAVVAVLGVGGAGAAVATAGSDNSRPAGGAHAAQSRQGSVVAFAAAKSRKPVDVESSFVLQPGQTDGRGADCPARAPYAVSGYWGTDDASHEADLVNVRNTPIGKTGGKWEVALKNTGATAVTVYVGAVCIPK